MTALQTDFGRFAVKRPDDDVLVAEMLVKTPIWKIASDYGICTKTVYRALNRLRSEGRVPKDFYGVKDRSRSRSWRDPEQEIVDILSCRTLVEIGRRWGVTPEAARVRYKRMVRDGMVAAGRFPPGRRPAPTLTRELGD